MSASAVSRRPSGPRTGCIPAALLFWRHPVSLEAAEIRHYFNQPHLLPVTEQHYCQGSVLKILKSRPSNRRRWLRRVRKARSELLQDQLRQSRITSFFTRTRSKSTQSSPPDNNAATPSESVIQDIQNQSQQHHRSAPWSITSSQQNHNQKKITQRTKQTRLHHFFPG